MASTSASTSASASTSNVRRGMEMEISEQVNIPVRDNARPSHSSANPANPRLYGYFSVVYLTGMFYLPLVPLVRKDEKTSPFETNGVFMIMSIVGVVFAILSTLILICAYYSLLVSSKMKKDIHYTILKTIGSFSAFLALFSLVMKLLLPPSLNWIGYLLVCVIFGAVVPFNFFGNGFRYLNNRKPNDFRVIYFTAGYIVLVPLSLVLVFFLPYNLILVPLVIDLVFWIPPVCFFIVSVITYIVDYLEAHQ